MGKRLRVVKKQEKYGDSARFNWQFDKFANLLGALGCSPHCDSEEDYTRFEVVAEDFERAIGYVEQIVKGEFVEDDEAEVYVADVEEAFYGFDKEFQDWDYILETMKIYWEERDKKGQSKDAS